MVRIASPELLEILNGTLYGKVIDERTLRRHREELGLDYEVDLGRYLGHLIERDQARRAKPADSYAEKKQKAAERSRAASSKGRDIAPLPEVVDPERKEACRYDFLAFHTAYLRDPEWSPWSDDHLEVIAAMQEAVLSGGKFALAMPRGSGKTTLSEGLALWALLYGHSKFCMIIGATVDAANRVLDSLKTQLETSDRLLEDFPEACYPIRCLEGITKRCQGQTYRGERTHISWLANEVIFPTIDGSECGSAVLRVRGITGGGIRGQKHTTPEGEMRRPDLVLLDDPQDDESARNPAQVDKRQRIINGTVMGMAGPGKPITVIMPCTVICQDDLAARYLDRKKTPEFHGIRKQLMRSLPADEKLWEEYFAIWSEDLAADRGPERANRFYAERRAKMDAGAVPMWEYRYEPGEISAIQHAMHLRYRDPVTFAAEYQNDPLDPLTTDLVLLTADEIAAKTRNFPRGQIPDDAELVVGFVDVQLHCLYYALAAVKRDMTGHVLDYGPWPKQPTRYFVYSNRLANPTGRQKTAEGVPIGKLSEDAQIRQALEALVTGDLMQRRWQRDDGAEFQLDLLLIDSGNWANAIYQFIRESPSRSRIMPSKGRGVKVTERKISESPRRPGEELGEEWIVPRASSKRPVRRIDYDTNHWKSEFQKRWKSPVGEPGCWTLYQAKPVVHRMIAEHATAEYATRVEAKGNVVDQWDLRPGRDNHLFDCLVGCLVAASRKGCAVPDAAYQQTQPKRKGTARRRLSDLRRQKKQGG